MRYVYAASVAILSTLFPAMLHGQGLSITNYQFVSQQTVNSSQVRVTYRADLVNSGGPYGSVTATVSSTNVFAVRTVPGSDTLTWVPVAGHSQTTSSGTFTILVNTAQTFSFSYLQWAFTTTAAGPVANAGPNQTVSAGTLVTLNGSGSTNPSGVGTLSYSWVFTSRPPNTHATLASWWTVSPSFVADVPGNFVITLTVSNSTASSTASVTISTLNSPPVANAGPNQTVALGSTVTLNGSGSSDVDGDPLTYQWGLIQRPLGSTAGLTASNTVTPTFVADKAGTYVAQLYVSDGHSTSSATVTISTLNTPPVANAGAGQVVPVGAPVQLNGSGSTDVDGNPLTYQWALIAVPAGSLASLSNATAVNPTFTPDVAGTYVAQLIVNDGHVNSTPSTVSVTTNSILPPTANAGPNQTVLHGTTVQLSGSGTDPQSYPLTYSWSMINKPAGSLAALSSATAANPTFLADQPGSYVVQLIVNDGFVNSAPATVTITTTNTPPVANAGPNQNVTAGDIVTLDGSGSSDADNDPLTYSWSLTTRPAGSVTFIIPTNTVAPRFIPDVAGTYVAQLIVSDGIASSNPSTVTIVAVPPPPITLGPSPLSLLTNGSGSLTLTLGAAAGSSGQVVNLVSSSPSVATVPPTITVSAGATTATVPVFPLAAGSTTITASATGYASGAAGVNVSNVLITLAPSPLSLAANASGTLTVSLTSPAGSGGQVINLASSNTGAATVPASVTIPEGASSTSVTVSAVSAGSTTITASAPNVGFTPGTATVNVTSVFISLTPNPLSLAANASGTLTVGLTSPAGPSGQVINLASSNTGAATVPASVTVPAGSLSTTVTVTPVGAGSTTITGSASSPAFTSGTATVNVTSVQISLSPNPLNMGNNATAQVTVTLSAPAGAGGQAINLASSNTSVASVPASVTVPAGSTTASATVTPGTAGTVTITGSAAGTAFVPGTTSVTVVIVAQILLPSNPSVAPSQTMNFPVTLVSPAPAGGLFVSLVSSDPSKVTVSPASFLVPPGATAPTSTPKITGVDFGSAKITASATGLISASQTVHVTATLSFFPASFTITGTARRFVSLILSAPAPANGVTINLSSDNTGVATVPSTVTFTAGTTSVSVPVTGVAAGSTSIHASAPPNIPDATGSVTVQ